MSVDKTLSKCKIQLLQHDPVGTGAENVSWVKAKDFEGFTIGYQRTAVAGALTALSIVVGESATPSTVAIVASKDVTVNPDAVGDYVFLEVSSAEIQKTASDAGISGVELYVSAQVTEAVDTQVSTILYLQSPANHAVEGLTSDSIA
jgi:hypothetical protein